MQEQREEMAARLCSAHFLSILLTRPGPWNQGGNLATPTFVLVTAEDRACPFDVL